MNPLSIHDEGSRKEKLNAARTGAEEPVREQIKTAEPACLWMRWVGGRVRWDGGRCNVGVPRLLSSATSKRFRRELLEIRGTP